MLRMLQSFALQKFEVPFQKYKARKCNTFDQRKRVNTSGRRLFGHISSLVIRTHFKHQI